MFWRQRRTGHIHHLVLVVTYALLASLLPGTTTSAQGQAGYLFRERVIETAEIGTPSPTGLAYLPSTGTLLMLDAGAAAPQRGPTTILTLDGDPAGEVTLPEIGAGPLNSAFDGHFGRLLFFHHPSKEFVAVEGVEAPGTARVTARYAAAALGIAQAQGMAVENATGRVFVLDVAGRPRVVAITPDSAGSLDADKALQEGRVAQIDLSGLAPARPRGIAFNPSDGHLYVFTFPERKLYEVTESGQVLSFRDFSSLNLVASEALVFAPSGDSTDDPANMNLYIADSRNAPGQNKLRGLGQIVELSLTDPTSGAAAVAALVAPAANLEGNLVRTIQTSQWSPPSPDPAGITYWPAHNTLFIADSEVDEMTIYQGHNLFESTLSGNLANAAGNTLAFSKEPTGVAIAPTLDNGHTFFSDDGKDRITDVNWGPDGQYQTGDDTITTFSTTPFGSADAEGLTYANGKLYVVDGLDKEVHVIDPGPNGRFDGVDDTVTHWDTLSLGQKDPEGIAFNPDTGTFFIVSNATNTNIIETTATGTLVNAIDISSINRNSPGGLEVAPSSDGSGAKNLYVVERGVDNNDDPNENDGKIYEIAIGGSPPPPPPSTGNLLANPGFETDANGDGRPDVWTSNSKFTRSNESVHSGSFAGKFFATDNSNATIKQTVTNLTGGTAYTFSGWVNVLPTSDSFKFMFQVQWRNSSNSTIRTDTIATITKPTAGWQQSSATLTAPSGTTRAFVRMVAKSLNLTFYVDDLSFGGAD